MTFLFPLLVIFSWATSPLLPVKTDSPRDTVRTFVEAMNDYQKGVETGNSQLSSRINDAIRCFAMPTQNNLTSNLEKRNAAIFLKETLDRVIVIDFEKIPEEPTIPRWRMKDTEIVLRPMTMGDRKDEWLITYDTWSRAKHFYKKVENLPYLEGAGTGASYRPPWLEKLFPLWTQGQILGLKKWQWLGIFFAIILGFLFKFVAQLCFSFVRYLFNLLKGSWQSAILSSIERPAGLLIATAFWYFALLFLKIDGLVFSILNAGIQISLGISIVWLCYKLIDVGAGVFSNLAAKTESPLDDQLVPFAERTLKVAAALLGILMILQNMGINVFSLLAGLGLGGLAFALAAKDTAANLFGSIMILVDRPFKIGDWVIVDSVEGNIEDIGFRSTRIRTFYDSQITVPNSLMATAKIDNMGERQYRRTVDRLGVTYDTSPEKLEAFLEGIRHILRANEHTRKDYFNVVFSGYRDSSLEILVYFFIVTNSWYKELIFKQNIYLEIYRLAEKLGVEFAYPTQSLLLQKADEKKPPAELPNDIQNITSSFGPKGALANPNGQGIYTQDT